MVRSLATRWEKALVWGRGGAEDASLGPGCAESWVTVPLLDSGVGPGTRSLSVPKGWSPEGTSPPSIGAARTGRAGLIMDASACDVSK